MSDIKVICAGCETKFVVSKTTFYRNKRWCGNEVCKDIIDTKVKHSNYKKAKRKIEKGKFKNRMGPEFESWVGSLNQRFDEYPQLINSIISDDEFWNTTLKLTLNI